MQHSRRNVILILTDQQHYRTLGVTGCRAARTPHLDALARSGVLFENHIVANPVCSPSRASIMTGLLPSRHGLWGNGCRLPSHHPTIASVMVEQGWQTAHFGKLHLVPIITRTAPHPSYGFQTCEVAEGDQQLLEDDYFKWLRRTQPELFLRYLDETYKQGHACAYTSTIPESHHLSSWVTDRSIDWLTRRRDQATPFFLSVGYFDPHHAFNPCEPYASLFHGTDVQMPLCNDTDLVSKPAHYLKHFEQCCNVTRDESQMRAIIRAYHAMIAHLDVCVGRLLRTLETLDLLDSTDIIFSSDHGEFLGEHGLLWKGPFLLDDLLRVPLIIYRARSRAARVNQVSSSVDLMATVQTLAGVDDSERVDGEGRSLLDFDLRPFPSGHPNVALAEWEAPSDSASASIRCLRTQDWKLVHYNRSSEGELYDLRHDPHERFNLYH
jgi:arylsulfatase